MKVKGDKPILKQESKTLLEKEFEKANNIINIKTKELNTEKYEKTVENSKLKGEEKVLEVKTRHLALELEDKERESSGLLEEKAHLEGEIEDLIKSVANNLNIVKDKRKELAGFKNLMSTEYSNKKNDCANVTEESKSEILQTKMKLNQMIFSNQMKKEECYKLKKQLEQIEAQYQKALSYEAQGVKKATTIFKELRDK